MRVEGRKKKRKKKEEKKNKRRGEGGIRANHTIYQ